MLQNKELAKITVFDINNKKQKKRKGRKDTWKFPAKICIKDSHGNTFWNYANVTYLSNNIMFLQCVPNLAALSTPHREIPCDTSLLVTSSKPTLPKCHLFSEAFPMLRHWIPSVSLYRHLSDHLPPLSASHAMSRLAYSTCATHVCWANEPYYLSHQ